MSPIRDLAAQQRGREVGRIRLGQRLPTKTGGSRPAKLETFRLTTGSQRVAAAAAAALGGNPRPWTTAPTAGQWEVLTDAAELAVAVPPGDAAISQHYELWSGGGCARRCDGFTEALTHGPCLCPPPGVERAVAAAEGRACKPTTRLSVILPDLPDLGIWRVESHGFYAAVELAGAAELLAGARAAGVIVPAVLRLEQRQRKAGGKTLNFGVPVLEILPTLRELAGMQGGARAALDYQRPPALGAAATGGATGPAVGAVQDPAAPEAATTNGVGAARAGSGDRGGDPGVARPGSAQACADAARRAGTREELRALGQYASARGWMEVMVADRADVHEELRSVFTVLAELFDIPAGPDA